MATKLKIRRKSKSTSKLKVKRAKKENRSVACVIDSTGHCPCDYFPTGSTALNLALSGKGDRGWARARVDNIVGDRSAGKTLLALEAAANFYYFICHIKSIIFGKKKEAIVVYNNPEGVMDFDVSAMYGEEFFNALKMIRSPHVQHMGRDFIRRAEALKKHQSLLYIVDTWDFLRSKEQLDRFQTSITKDEEVEGSFDGEKQKWASGFFAKTSELMDKNKTDATLIIVSQIRKNMKAKMFQKQNYRTGGKAFDHAMHQEVWLREVHKHEGTKYGEKRIYAIDVEAKVEKNKTAKPYRKAEFTILYDYGIDDISSCFSYAIGTPSTKSKKTWKGEEFTSLRQAVLWIERKGYEKQIREEAEKKYQKVDRAFQDDIAARKARWNSPITG